MENIVGGIVVVFCVISAAILGFYFGTRYMIFAYTQARTHFHVNRQIVTLTNTVTGEKIDTLGFCVTVEPTSKEETTERLESIAKLIAKEYAESTGHNTVELP